MSFCLDSNQIHVKQVKLSHKLLKIVYELDSYITRFLSKKGMTMTENLLEANVMSLANISTNCDNNDKSEKWKWMYIAIRIRVRG